MAAPGLFCEHKRLRSVCPLCGSARAGAATPVRNAVTHDVDATIHAFRRACHARFADYLRRVHDGITPLAAYEASYDAMGRRGKVHSEEEDPTSYRGGIYRGLVKMFDVTVDDRRIQGYNGLADWDEMRDFVFRKFSPTELADAMRAKRILLHGGNGAWPRQQIATELLRSDAVKEAVLDVAWGEMDVPAAEVDDAEIVVRLTRLDAAARKLGGKTGATQFGSKILHILAPTRFAPLTPRATSEVGEELGFPLPDVQTPADYPAFCAAFREIAKAKGHDDLGRTDMLVSDTWDMLQG